MRTLLAAAAGGLLATAAFAQPEPASGPPAASDAATRSSYAILYRPGPAWRAGEPMARQALGPHVRYYRDLQARGIVYAAGSLGPQRGLAIIAAASADEARAVMAADPAVTAGVFAAEIEPFGPRFGGAAPVPLVVD